MSLCLKGHVWDIYKYTMSAQRLTPGWNEIHIHVSLFLTLKVSIDPRKKQYSFVRLTVLCFAIAVKLVLIGLLFFSTLMTVEMRRFASFRTIISTNMLFTQGHKGYDVTPYTLTRYILRFLITVQFNCSHIKVVRQIDWKF